MCREVEQALKPGVHALIDACSVDDLQYLHSVFGGEQTLLNQVVDVTLNI